MRGDLFLAGNKKRELGRPELSLCYVFTDVLSFDRSLRGEELQHRVALLLPEG